MGLKKKLHDIRFDARLVDWNLRRGQVKQEEISKHLQNLEDVANNAIKIRFEDEDQGNSSAGTSH